MWKVPVTFRNDGVLVGSKVFPLGPYDRWAQGSQDGLPTLILFDSADKGHRYALFYEFKGGKFYFDVKAKPSTNGHLWLVATRKQ